MKVAGKEVVKQLLGEVPFTAELYWLLRQRGKPLHSRFSLRHLQSELPDLIQQAEGLRKNAAPGRKVFIFATLHYWIEHAALLGVALAAQGHKVTLGFLPYAEWQSPINRFDLRRQNVYASKVLSLASPVMETVSFLSSRSLFTRVPDDLMKAVQQITVYDTQYTLQVEDVDPESEVYKLRMERNTEIARAALGYLKANRPDVVIIPNGTVQELGVVYRVARHLGIRTVTYEFGDQRQRIWLAQNAEVMRQETDNLWQARDGRTLSPDQLERMRSLFMARQRGALWENFARLWQDTPAEGGEKARAALGLDQRPVVLLATNVLGDSLTLGRQVFSQSMAEWISRTVQYFAGRPDIQFIVRVHPGEVLTHGLSMVDVVKQVLPKLPEHIRLIGPKDKVNTYDLIEVTDLGLVYTTTVGLEMAMCGLPVIVTGQTHYRGRGFTYDPDSWVTYFKLLGQILARPSAFRMARMQVESAWEYAYHFFFEYPRPFPWHLVRVWDDYKLRSLAQVCGPEGMSLYGDTFKYLVGEPINWQAILYKNGAANGGVHPTVASLAATPVSTLNVDGQKAESPQAVDLMTTAPEVDGIKQRVRQFYDRIGWQTVEDGSYQNARYEDLRPVSREYIQRCHLRVKRFLPPAGRYLLDAGSGPVQYAEYLTYSEGYKRRVCVDISIVALQEARRRIGEHGLFVVSDIANLPFVSEPFDGVVSLHTLHHLPLEDQLKAYEELFRVLKPGRSGVVVNGWTDSPLMRWINWLVHGMERLGHWMGKKPPAQNPKGPQITPAGTPKPEPAAKDPVGTFIRKQDAAWLREQLSGKMKFEIYSWRSVSVRFLRAVIHSATGGRTWLRLIYWLEDRFPRFMGEKGQYPLIVIRK